MFRTEQFVQHMGHTEQFAEHMGPTHQFDINMDHTHQVGVHMVFKPCCPCRFSSVSSGITPDPLCAQGCGGVFLNVHVNVGQTVDVDNLETCRHDRVGDSRVS